MTTAVFDDWVGFLVLSFSMLEFSAGGECVFRRRVG